MGTQYEPNTEQQLWRNWPQQLQKKSGNTSYGKFGGPDGDAVRAKNVAAPAANSAAAAEEEFSRVLTVPKEQDSHEFENLTFHKEQDSQEFWNLTNCTPKHSKQDAR